MKQVINYNLIKNYFSEVFRMLIVRCLNELLHWQVPVQRVTKYPLLLSRLLKVTPGHHEDRSALQESRERIEHALEHMNQVRMT